jgi:hypothetical protein
MKLVFFAFSLVMCLVANPSSAQHSMTQVTKVTVMNGIIFVRGTNATGGECQDYAGFYGTLSSPSTDVSHKQYYALALAAQITGKGLFCYVAAPDSTNKTCRMENCSMQ